MTAPSVGRIVHYVSEGSPVLPDGSQKYLSRCVAALISELPFVASESEPEQVIGLAVVNPTGVFFRPLSDGGCRYDEGEDVQLLSSRTCGGRLYRGGTWHWPARV